MCEVEQREVVTLGDVVQGRRQVPARVQGHPGHGTRDDKTRDTWSQDACHSPVHGHGGHGGCGRPVRHPQVDVELRGGGPGTLPGTPGPGHGLVDMVWRRWGLF